MNRKFSTVEMKNTSTKTKKSWLLVNLSKNTRKNMTQKLSETKEKQGTTVKGKSMCQSNQILDMLQKPFVVSILIQLKHE